MIIPTITTAIVCWVCTQCQVLHEGSWEDSQLWSQIPGPTPWTRACSFCGPWLPLLQNGIPNMILLRGLFCGWNTICFQYVAAIRQAGCKRLVTLITGDSLRSFLVEVHPQVCVWGIRAQRGFRACSRSQVHWLRGVGSSPAPTPGTVLTPCTLNQTS